MGSFSDVRDARASMCVISRGVTCQGGPRNNSDRPNCESSKFTMSASSQTETIGWEAPRHFLRRPKPNDSSRNETECYFIWNGAAYARVGEGFSDMELSGDVTLEER